MIFINKKKVDFFFEKKKVDKHHSGKFNTVSYDTGKLQIGELKFYIENASYTLQNPSICNFCI